MISGISWRTLSLCGSDLETVAKGMVDIFLSLTHYEGLKEDWDELSGETMEFKEVLE